MFSVMMIAASTKMPTAIASPPSVIVLIPAPHQYMTMPARTTDVGRVTVTITADRTSPRSSRSTVTTSTAPMRMDRRLTS